VDQKHWTVGTGTSHQFMVVHRDGRRRRER
jgi:hypothetical protein